MMPTTTSGSAPEETILVVEDDEAAARAVMRALRPFRPVTCAATAAEARNVLLGAPPLCGAVFDVRLPDGNGLELLALARGRMRRLPLLVLTGEVTPQVLYAAYDHGAELLLKGDAFRRLHAFGLSCAIAAMEPDELVRQALVETSTRFGLTPAEVEVLHGALHGRRAEWFARERGMPVPTYKSRVASLLRRAMADSIDALIREVFWDALRDAADGRRAV